jgi:polygalacturonase
MKRRSFVTGICRSGLAVWGVGRIPIGWGEASLRTSGPVVNVREFGALGDGKTDDTPAFNRCLQSLRKSGGTASVPKGVYRIDPVQSVILVDNLTFDLDSEAVLQAIPVGVGAYAIIRGKGVRNVLLKGGAVVGERNAHSGTAGEWGMGVDLRRCSDTRIEGMKISECWGDGIYVGGESGRESERVTIRNCTSRRNRRQGLSMTGCRTALIEDCDFSETAGTPPQSGIDLEPDGGAVVRNVTINRCTTSRNAGWGIAIGANVGAITLQNSHVSANSREGIAIALATECSITATAVKDNSKHGISLQGTKGISVLSDTICGNGRASPGHYNNILVDKGAIDTIISDNVFSCDGSNVDAPRYDVRVNSPNCIGTKIVHNQFRRGRITPGGVNDHGTQTIISTEL